MDTVEHAAVTAVLERDKEVAESLDAVHTVERAGVVAVLESDKVSAAAEDIVVVEVVTVGNPASPSRKRQGEGSARRDLLAGTSCFSTL